MMVSKMSEVNDGCGTAHCPKESRLLFFFLLVLSFTISSSGVSCVHSCLHVDFKYAYRIVNSKDLGGNRTSSQSERLLHMVHDY